MTDEIPYYERTLDSFADHIITRQSSNGERWHAVLDCGLRGYVSDPDFSSYGYGASQEQSASNCASAIRANARGIGKFAPKELLTPSYDLQWCLMAHWDRKEQIERAGFDANQAVLEASRAPKKDPWKLEGPWLDWMKDTRELEFRFQHRKAVLLAALKNGEFEPEMFREYLVTAIKEEFKTGTWRTKRTDETWVLLEARVENEMNELQILEASSPKI